MGAISIEQDLSVREAAEAIRGLQSEIGPYCEISVRLDVGLSSLSAGVTVNKRSGGYGSDFFADGKTFVELIASLRSTWAHEKKRIDRVMVRDMAERIIDAYARVGACRVADLCLYKFSRHDVRRYWKLALAEANRRRALGPYKIEDINSLDEAA